MMNVKLEEFFANKKAAPKKLIKKILLIITFTVALIFALFNFDRVWGFITGAISLAVPRFSSELPSLCGERSVKIL